MKNLQGFLSWDLSHSPRECVLIMINFLLSHSFPTAHSLFLLDSVSRTANLPQRLHTPHHWRTCELPLTARILKRPLSEVEPPFPGYIFFYHWSGSLLLLGCINDPPSAGCFLLSLQLLCSVAFIRALLHCPYNAAFFSYLFQAIFADCMPSTWTTKCLCLVLLT